MLSQLKQPEIRSLRPTDSIPKGLLYMTISFLTEIYIHDIKTTDWLYNLIESQR